MERPAFRILGIVLTLVFVAFAVVQYNDPDPIVWIAIYAAMAGMCAASCFKRLPYLVSLLPMLAAILGAVALWPDEFIGLDGKMDSRPNVELARESLGLVICALACAYVCWRSWVRRSPANPVI